MPDYPEYLRPAAAAQMLGVHPNTVRNWIQSGVIKDHWAMPSGETRPSRAEIERLLAEQGSHAANEAWREWTAG